MNGLAPTNSSAGTDIGAILLALLAADGEGSGLDADKLRGRDGVTPYFRLSFAPLFTPPPSLAETVGQALFGV